MTPNTTDTSTLADGTIVAAGTDGSPAKYANLLQAQRRAQLMRAAGMAVSGVRPSRPHYVVVDPTAATLDATSENLSRTLAAEVERADALEAEVATWRERHAKVAHELREACCSIAEILADINSEMDTVTADLKDLEAILSSFTTSVAASGSVVPHFSANEIAALSHSAVVGERLALPRQVGGDGLRSNTPALALYRVTALHASESWDDDLGTHARVKLGLAHDADGSPAEDRWLADGDVGGVYGGPQR